MKSKLVKESLNEDGGYTVEDAMHNIFTAIKAATEDLDETEYAEFLRRLSDELQDELKYL